MLEIEREALDRAEWRTQFGRGHGPVDNTLRGGENRDSVSRVHIPALVSTCCYLALTAVTHCSVTLRAAFFYFISLKVLYIFGVESSTANYNEFGMKTDP